jgi:hypothetical protein
VGIPHVELLPYRLPLALLARFFLLHPEPSPRSRELLSRWVWRGAITGLHRGDRIDVVRGSLAAIGNDEERSVQALLAHVSAVAPKDPIPREYNFRTAQTKLQVNALLALQPRDLRTGELINGPKLISLKGADALPRIFNSLARSLVKRHGTGLFEDTQSLMRGLANRLVHPIAKEQSLLATLRNAPSEPALLLSHGIPLEAHAALRNGHVLDFLMSRTVFLSNHVRQFLDSKARWEESDRGSLKSLIIPDEED